MPIYLKQSTAGQEIPLGHFVDSADGDTAETGLTIANTDIKLWKAGATALASKNSGGATHMAGGVYYCVLDATDTATAGPLAVFVHVTGALPVRLECVVLPANVYDSLFGADKLQVDLAQIGGSAVSTTTAQLGVNLVQISGDATAADNLESYCDGGASMPVDAVKISGSATAADGVEANIGNLNAAVSSRSSHAAADVWAVATRVLTANTNLNDPTAGQISDAVWAGGTRTLTGAVNITSDGNAIDQTKIANLDAAVSTRSTLTAAQVNAEMVDVLTVDTVAEMSQGAPPAAPTIQQALNYLYRDWRNKKETTAGELTIYDDAGTTRLVKADLSDDGTTFTRGEMGSGA